MCRSETVLQADQNSEFLKFNEFTLNDKAILQKFTEKFIPWSCEYNFANLFAWQKPDKLFWTFYRDRLVIYDTNAGCSLMPLGDELNPEQLFDLSLSLKDSGLSPDFSLVTFQYLKKHPEIKTYYTITKQRDNAEYIYEVDKLSTLLGKKLHKKRNLISQFKRNNSDFKVDFLNREYREKALHLAKNQLNRFKNQSPALEKEFIAIKSSLTHFDHLELEGLVLITGNKLAGFSVFSQLNHSTYDIQFEKFDMDYKGAAQVINQETAKYLKGKCSFINREQDLGIQGLRQAKMSYEPLELITPYKLVFDPAN